ncbi:hypothetical protein BDV96DRAFT_605006 [Lophiotrema nucula]|uniref:Zn(2)-C6 fungal-type domain-containing protein n=1 Tax=Lophiotrema nucula TaxID=690887 RepID=A0A6A5YPX8_9PLEO|nr:hypothetical protein BDV96DRAFT_605006 [Lophiotrema nucula]
MSLSYISSTRKKSCKNCVKAKRRCDLGYPCCKRCFAKQLTCNYPTASRVRETEEVVVRLRTPDLIPFDSAAPSEPANTSTAELQDDGFTIDPVLLQSSDSSGNSHSSSSPESSSPETITEPWPPSWNWQTHPAGPPITIMEGLLPQIWEPSILSDTQVGSSLNRVCGFIPALAYSGSTDYLHEALYQDWQPQAYQDSIALSSLYMCKTGSNQSILRRAIDSKINGLISQSKTWTLREHLAAVQALIIYQIIRLFDPELGMQAQAEKHNTMLEVWVAHLWKRFFNEPQKFANCFDNWVFQESLRRTVLLSVFLRGIWSAVTKGGVCDQVPVLSRLPIAGDARLWEYKMEEWVLQEPWENKEKVVTYQDFSSTWTGESDIGALTEWQKLLLVACRGQDDPRLLNC